MALSSFTATVQSNNAVSPDTYIITFETLDDFLFEPGQYMIILVPDGDKTVRRLYSIASSSHNTKTFDLFVKIISGGVGSSYLASLTPGTTVSCMGPAGVFRLRQNNLAKVFMTTGTGFAPVRSFLLSQKSPVAQPWTLLWGDRTYKDVSFQNELLSLEATLGSFHFLYCLSRQSGLEIIPAEFQNNSRMGRIDAVFNTLLSGLDLASTEFYLCGSRTVVEGLREYLSGLGVLGENVIFEKY